MSPTELFDKDHNHIASKVFENLEKTILDSDMAYSSEEYFPVNEAIFYAVKILVKF